MSKSSVQKANELQDKIKKAQSKLKQLRQKRLIEIGKLAASFGLHEISDNELAQQFKKIAGELNL